MWWIIASASAFASVAWLLLLREQRRVRADGLELSPEPATPGADVPSMCVIVPVRNAAPALQRCVSALLAQDHPGLSIVIVDDRSDDDTAAVAGALARDHDRVSTVRIDAVPPGWLGKSHALWAGSQSTVAEWLLFVDDDCVLHPAAARTAVAEATRRSADLLSLWPRHDGRTLWERLLIPLCGGIIAIWFARDQGRGDGGFANGQFLLIRRDAYARIGGHRSVRSALIEDVALAARAREFGLISFVGSGRALLSVRMYDGLRSTFDGWSRIFIGALNNPAKLLASVLWLLFGSLLPYIALPVLLACLVSQGGLHASQTVALALALLHLALQVTVSVRFWGMGGCDRRALWGYPLAVVIVTAMLVRALYVLLVSRRVRWRATMYTIDGRARIVPRA